MRFSRKTARAVEVLRGDLSRDPHGLRAHALELITELGQADVAAWYEFGLVDGDPLPVRWRFRGDDDGAARKVLEERLISPAGDPRLTRPHMDRRFAPLRSLYPNAEDFYATRYYEAVWRPRRFEDQCRMLVFHDGALLDFIGCFRRKGDPTFGRSDVARLSPVADAIADALIAARRMERADRPEQGCDLLLTPNAVVEYASESGARLLGAPGVPGALASWLRRVDCRVAEATPEAKPAVIEGHRLRWTRLYGGGQVRYLVQLERVTPVRLHPGFVLSRTQRRIARLACAGASAAEIGSALQVSAETVRTHLRQAYGVLGVSSRAELVRVLGDMPAES